jgi:hypothetical protein
MARLVGTITDPSGAIIPSATVVATNVATHISTRAVTNGAGQYVIPDLVPGDYSITGEKTGFVKKTITGIVLQVGQMGQINLSLELGAVTQTVQVTGHPPLLDHVSSDLGQVIDRQQVATLPLNGRNFMQLALLTAGVSEGVSADWTGVQMYSANGLTGENNNYIMDGISNRESASNTVIESPSVDAIQEFKAETGMFTAEHQAAGMVINVVTKSGTNQIHGAAYDYLRNDALDASGFFPTSDRVKPPLRRNQFGAAAGGRFVRDKHFWFASYEGERQTQGSVQIGLVPTAQQISGQVDTPITDPLTGEPFPSNNGITQLPADRISPVLQTILSYYPGPNTSQYGANFVNSENATFKYNSFLIKTDHYLTDKDSLSVRFSFKNGSQFAPGGLPILDGDYQVNSTRGLSIGYHRTLRPNLLNELRLGYTRWLLNAVPEVAGTKYTVNPGILGIGLPVGATNPLTTPYSLFMSGYVPIYPAAAGYNSLIIQVMNDFEVGDNLTWVRGSHSIKLGGLVYRAEFKSNSLGTIYNGDGNYTGQFTGDPVADTLLDYPAQVTKASTAPNNYPRQTKFGGFLQDDWRATSRLTLNLGVRYDVDLPINDIILGVFDPSFGGLRFPQYTIDHSGFDVANYFATVRPDIPIKIDPGKSVYSADTNNIAPRLGFAYSLGGHQTTVVRGGAGVFFTSPPSMGIRCTSSIPPFTQRFQAFSDPTVPTISLVSTGSNPNEKLPIRVWTFPGDRKFVNGVVDEWALSVQREISPSLMVEVGYIGNHLIRGLSALDINQAPVPGPSNLQDRVPFPSFAAINMYGNNMFSMYDGLNVRVTKQASHGLSFLASYRFGKELNNADEADRGLPQNINCPISCEKGLADGNTAQRLSVSYSYDLPFGRGRAFLANRSGFLGPFVDGWTLGGIVTAESGFPVSPGENGIGSNTGSQVGTRPDRIGDGNLPPGQRSPDHYWDPSAFVESAPYTFGTAGRNILIGPGFSTWDFSLRKNFPFHFLGEQAGLEFRAEMFNFLNHVNFGMPDPDIDDPTFGQIFSLSTDPREVQFALRLHW